MTTINVPSRDDILKVAQAHSPYITDLQMQHINDELTFTVQLENIPVDIEVLSGSDGKKNFCFPKMVDQFNAIAEGIKDASIAYYQTPIFKAYPKLAENGTIIRTGAVTLVTGANPFIISRLKPNGLLGETEDNMRIGRRMLADALMGAFFNLFDGNGYKYSVEISPCDKQECTDMYLNKIAASPYSTFQALESYCSAYSPTTELPRRYKSHSYIG